MVLLQVNNLTKSYGTTQAVRSISFAIESGHCVALLGPNGAGKTSTLRMLADLVNKTSGTILFDGKPVTDIRPYLGYLPQHPSFHEWMTGQEFMMYIGQLTGLSRSEAKERTASTLARLDMESAAKRPIRSYSGGMKQRLGICQALMNKPRLLILDEPVSALDPVGRREVLELLAAIRSETTVLYSTHVLHDAEEVSDDVIILVAGKIVMAGPLKDIRQMHQQPKIVITAATSLESFHDALRSITGVNQLDGSGTHVSLFVTDVSRVRNAVLQTVISQGIPVEQIEFGQSTLEDLFMEAVKS